MKPHKHAEVIHAIADGKEVEFKGTSNIWRDPINTGMNPITFLDIEWRIKPEPKPDVVAVGIIALSDDFKPCMEKLAAYKTEFRVSEHWEKDNVRIIFDGETGKLKSAEVLNA